MRQALCLQGLRKDASKVRRANNAGGWSGPLLARPLQLANELTADVAVLLPCR